ncbi:fatty acid-binding protein-like [Pollicipes pollicipes]|uniref:fatty acid-binding protein-like n=1 Tax=Pollicipes pollicipes TaxID=41117 RepID=UPI001885A243|nr:fatty acid-binding protein-like [Pollicipes pollicipes]
MVNCEGSFQLVSTENDDAVFVALGMSFVMRKMIQSIKPTITVAINGDHWTITTKTSIKTKVHEFDLGVPHKLTRVDGKVVTGVVTKENDHKLLDKHTDDAGVTVIGTREFTDTQMVHTMRVGDIVGVRTYQRI